MELIPYRNGAWDDLPCGNLPDEDHDKDWGFTKYFICEHGKTILTLVASTWNSQLIIF